MSNTKPTHRKWLSLVIGAIVLLLLLYVGGNFILPGSIKSSYQARNCNAALEMNAFYTKAYPAFMVTDHSLAGQLTECNAYIAASAKGDTKAWQDSYNAYKTYTDAYPKGLFLAEAREHSAAALVAGAKELQARKKYQDAFANLELVSKTYGDTSVAAQVVDPTPEIYAAWGADLRNSDDFAGAENKFKEFKTWAEGAKKVEAAQTAQHELARTYLAWGFALQSQEKFEDAKAKLDMAGSTDPGSVADLKVAQAKLYTEWGDAFVEQKDFPQAINLYKTALTFTESKDQPAVQDRLANVYLKSAAGLRDGEDFLGALQQIDLATENAGTDAFKTSIASAKTDTYTAFSKSSGSQAQEAMFAAAGKVCGGQPLDYPIFGIDADHVGAYFYPNKVQLSEKVNATTPGAMHYVACNTETTVSETEVEKRDCSDLRCVSNSEYMISVRGKFTMERIIVSWNIRLKNVKTGKMDAAKIFSGLILNWQDLINIVRPSNDTFRSFRGPDPNADVISSWIEIYLK